MPTQSYTYATVTGLTTGYFIINGVYSEKVPRPVSYGPGHWSRQYNNTPGFHKGYRSNSKRIRPVDLPMNGFLFTKEMTQHSDAEVSFKQIRNYGAYSSLEVTRGYQTEGVIYPSRSSSDSEALNNKAASRLLTGLKDQSVNAGVAVAEGRKTLDLIASTAVNLAKAGNAIKKADFAGAARALGVPLNRGAKKRMRVSNSVGSNWLALQYGWLPLMSDIYGLAQFVAKANNYVNRTKQSSSASKTGSYMHSYLDGMQNVADSWTSSHTVRYVVYFTEQSGGTPLVALGLTNPLAIAWELVPFSFVVDWFLPVGTFLNNLDATQGLVFVKGCRTEFWRGISTRHIGGSETVNGPGSMDGYYANHTSTKTEVYCRRDALSGFPLSPVPQFKNPLSGRKGDFAHEINCLALLTQAFK